MMTVNLNVLILLVMDKISDNYFYLERRVTTLVQLV